MAQQANHALPDGYRLEDYTIECQLSLGGFSIVYLASDAEGNRVAIKEYLPNSLALRAEGEIRPQITPEHEAAFRYGMKCFFEEGRALARLSHPNVIRVLNFFRANDTVYMVMEYERGRTLQEFIQTHREGMTESFIRGVFTRLLNGLREVHSHKLLHLDIKPSNIYLRNDDTPVLIDFGAARQTLAADEPMLKPMYTPGFASPEHYQSREVTSGRGATSTASAPRCTPASPAARRRRPDRACRTTAGAGHGALGRAVLGPAARNHRLVPAASNHLYRPQSVFALQKALAEAVDTAASRRKSRHWLDRVVGKYSQGWSDEIHHLPGKPPGRAPEQRGPHRLLLLARSAADGRRRRHGRPPTRRDRRADRRADIGRALFSARPSRALPTRSASCRRACVNAHHAIIDYAARRRLSDTPRTTCVACVVQDGIAYWAHCRRFAAVPDARRQGRRPDTGSLARSHAGRRGPDHRGAARRCTPTATRSTVASAGPSARRSNSRARPRSRRGDILLLCTDGVWGAASGEQMAVALQGVPT